MESEQESTCDNTCCVRNIVLLYEGEEFGAYLRHHAKNYKLKRKEISIELQNVNPSSSFLPASSNSVFSPPVFEHDNITKGETLVDYINEFGGAWDGAVFPSHLTGALEESDQLWDWNDYLEKQRNDEYDSKAEIEWADILPFFRSQAQQQVGRRSKPKPSSFFEWKSLTDQGGDAVSTRTLYAPLDGDVLSLYYRKDLFEQHQIPIPRTWDEYRDAAIYFYGKPLGPNNSPIAGSCVARKASLSSDDANDMDSYLTSLILSTMTQTKGTASGFLLDPETAEPILGEAMEETLLFLAQESVLSEGDRSDDSKDLPNVAWKLNEGSCAMTLSWANLLNLLVQSDQLENIGVAPTPGSNRVLDRTSGKLKDCTSESCPYGTYYDDIGIVNRPSYSAFGGWVGGVSSGTTSSKQNDMADFFSYISNPTESLGDVLPNDRSNFASPYRYSQTAASRWIDAGFDEEMALQYTEAISAVNSENTVSDIRIPTGSSIRGIIDQEVQNYMIGAGNSKFEAFKVSSSVLNDLSSGVAANMEILRMGVTDNMDRRIRDTIASSGTKTVLKNYQSSLSYHNGLGDVDMNYIQIPYRDTGWGAAILICFGSIAVMLWVLFNRKKPVMRAFQPILMIQTALGFFLMGATLFPLGFDDSLFSKNTLDITCMVTPWVYVLGFTMFFSSEYAKIQVCIDIFENPGKHDRMMVRPRDSFKLFCKLFVLNGSLLAIWNIVDPLRWSRIEKTTYGSAYPFGTIESYGTCRSERFRYPGFAIAIFVFNLLCCFVAMLQALKSRLLVLEYRQMQWLQLCFIPFFEAWIIGGPVIVLLHDQPTSQYVTFVLIITSSVLASAAAIFGPKEFFVRKHTLLPNEFEPERPQTPFIRILKHPKFESQKHVANLQNRLERYTTANTELAIDIRVLQEKFRLLTEKEKLAAVRGSIYSKGVIGSDNSMFKSIMTDEDESNSEKRERAMFKTALQDMKARSTRTNMVITKDSSANPRVSELSINMDELNQLRSEAGKLFTQDDSGPSGGKSGRSMLFIESISGSSFGVNSRISEEGDEDLEPTPDELEEESQGKDISSFSSVTDRDETNKDMQSLNQMVDSDSSSVDGSEDMDQDLKDLNQMIELDNMRDLQVETMLMAEEFKLNSSLMEDVSDLQPDFSERERNLRKMVHSDNVEDLQAETMLMAEKFKMKNGMLETIPDLQADESERSEDNVKHDGSHTLDVSNATGTSVSSATMVTENHSKAVPISPDAGESKVLAPLPDAVDTSSSSTRSNSDSPEPIVMSSTGESSGGDVLASEINMEETSSVSSKNQDAGEPSSDSHNNAASTRSSGNAGTNPQPPSDSGRSNSFSINGWAPVSAIAGLLADLSDSTSTASHRSSFSDSIASLEVAKSPRNSGGIQIAKDIESILHIHGFDAKEIAAGSSHSRGSLTSETNEDAGASNGLAASRQKKRELEARRLAISRHQQKESP